MQDTDLFQLALGLSSPWIVTRSEFNARDARLDLYVDFARGSRFACARCGREGCAVHDTKEENWRHLDFFQHRTLLHARTPRVTCPECGVRKVETPWARDKIKDPLVKAKLKAKLSENIIASGNTPPPPPTTLPSSMNENIQVSLDTPAPLTSLPSFTRPSLPSSKLAKRKAKSETSDPLRREVETVGFRGRVFLRQPLPTRAFDRPSPLVEYSFVRI